MYNQAFSLTLMIPTQSTQKSIESRCRRRNILADGLVPADTINGWTQIRIVGGYTLLLIHVEYSWYVFDGLCGSSLSEACFTDDFENSNIIIVRLFTKNWNHLKSITRRVQRTPLTADPCASTERLPCVRFKASLTRPPLRLHNYKMDIVTLKDQYSFVKRAGIIFTPFSTTRSVLSIVRLTFAPGPLVPWPPGPLVLSVGCLIVTCAPTACQPAFISAAPVIPFQSSDEQTLQH